MKKYNLVILSFTFYFLLVSCAHYPPDRYNTQKGATVGAGTGALIGQAIGGNTQSTLIGLAAGTILGALVGNAVDQDYQAVRDAAQNSKPVIYYDKNGHAVEAIPEGTNEQNCQTVRKRIWEDGKLVKETVEEVCSPPAPAIRYYLSPPPPAYYYGWLGWPFYPHFSFYFGRPYYHVYYRHGHYRYRHHKHGHYRHHNYRHRGWHRR